ncbi:MAG: hypothetical protein ACFFB0_08550 [Promethearchaeota archaeon]
MTQKDTFKKCFIIGLILFLASLFLDWYSFYIYGAFHEVIVTGHFSMVFGWSIHTTQPNILTDQYEIPEAFFIAIISIIIIILAFYDVLFRDIDTDKNHDRIIFSSWITICIWSLIFINLFAFPLLFFIPRDLNFPFAYYEDLQTHSLHFCAIGPGYIAQIIAFVLITPYASFHYQTIRRFDKKEKTVEQTILNAQEPLDLDKLLAEEEVKLKS